MSGCTGCRDDSKLPVATNQGAAIQAKELRQLPGGEQSNRLMVKPGHWMTMTQPWQANAEDLRGEMAVIPKIGKNGAVLLGSSRPAVLPKGQSKQIDTRVLVPIEYRGERASIDISTRFEAVGQAASLDASNPLALNLAPHEFFFVVLSSRPSQHTVLQISDWARAPQAEFSDQVVLDYRIAYPEGDSLLPLPDTVFEWTSTAYLFWDDVAPEKLTLDQRNALRDWVYWGGQLIINGPGAAQLFVDSDLADLLPIETVRSVGLEPTPLIQLVESWSVASDKSVGTVTGLLRGGAEKVGVAGELKPAATHLDGESSQLLAEISLGRGRVVLSRFDLSASWILKWGSLQSFWNGLLLRRPPRAYENVNDEAVLGFASSMRGQSHDARLNSRLRFFARDGRLDRTQFVDNEEKQAEGSPSSVEDGRAKKVAAPPTSRATQTGSEPHWIAPGESYEAGGGVAAWTDRSDTAQVLAACLRDEAGIDVPSVGFVARSLAIYLIILVPVNYFVFWLLGRLEWAWVMVPVIGLVGAAWIARSASLDIGFARSRTEIDLIELYPNYSRGHVSRFIAIYNSLSTNYEIRFANRDAVGAPFGIFQTDVPMPDVRFRQAFDQGVSLSGISIASNQTTTIHAEQMLDMGGTISIENPQLVWTDAWKLVNGTSLTLYDVIIVGRDPQGNLVHAVPGLVEAGEVVKVDLRSGPANIAEQLPMSLDRFMRAFVTGETIGAQQLTMLGRVEHVMDGVEIAPLVSQTTGQSLVIAHLNTLAIPSPQVDVNLRSDINVLDSDVADETLLQDEQPN